MSTRRPWPVGASLLTVVLAAGVSPSVPAQAPPSPARLAELSEQWADPVTEEPPGTRYRLFETAVRGKGTRGSYLVYLPPSYDKEPARRYPVLYWLHGGFGNPRQGAWAVQHLDRGHSGGARAGDACRPPTSAAGRLVRQL
jgi:acetyl esterase/lipase